MRSLYDVSGGVRVLCLVVHDGIEMGKCSFNTAWLKDEIYSKWLSMDRTNKHAALCRVCERVILLTTMGTKAVNSHMKSESRVDVFLHEKVTVR